MVVKIQQGAASCRSPLDYNERKVAAGEADLVSIRNIADSSVATIRGTFDRFENNPAISAKTGALAFHMTVNPGPGEQLDALSAARLADELMRGLGYGDQPYAVYRHRDIGREHFHVVSVRVGRDGRVISNSFERRRLQQLMRELGPRYGFRIGKDRCESRRRGEGTILRFDPSRGEVSAQLLSIFKGCLDYSFTTERQLSMLLEHFGARVIRKNDPDGAHLFLQGLDSDGNPCTRPVPQSDLGEDLSGMMEKALERGQERHAMKRQERSRVAGLVKYCLGISTSRLHFERMLARKDITAIFSRTGEGHIFGATFIDHGTRCVFRCSELGEGLGAGLFRKAEEEGQWKERGPSHAGMEEHTSRPCREEPTDPLSDIIESGLSDREQSREQDIRKKRCRKMHI